MAGGGAVMWLVKRHATREESRSGTRVEFRAECALCFRVVRAEQRSKAVALLSRGWGRIIARAEREREREREPLLYFVCVRCQVAFATDEQLLSVVASQLLVPRSIFSAR
jgi:hypothetical protein